MSKRSWKDEIWDHWIWKTKSFDWIVKWIIEIINCWSKTKYGGIKETSRTRCEKPINAGWKYKCGNQIDRDE